MKVRYIYSACLEIYTEDVCILTDPWFTEGIYDGSWYQFPKIDDPLSIINEPDLIYVSHIHPDHYDPAFLKKLFDKWGEKPVLISDHENNYLHLRAKYDGIKTEPTAQATYGDTQIQIIPNITGSISDIDSALFVNDGKHSVLNLNDCGWNDDHVSLLQSLTKPQNQPIDLLAVGYTTAGPYPQNYFNIDTEIDALETAAIKVKMERFEHYKNYCSAFPSKYHLPFAGKYILGGKLSKLNQYRGVADAVEVTHFDDAAIVLGDFGKGWIDLETDQISHRRVNLYAEEDLELAIEKISKKKMDYEKEILIPFDKINFNRLLRVSYENAIKKSEVTEDYYFLIEATSLDEGVRRFLLNSNSTSSLFEEWSEANGIPEPYSHITIDYRYLYGLLTGTYHWNSAAVGSQYFIKRRPDIFSTDAERFLFFLSAC